MDGLDISWPAPGRYVIAVSGGADSIVLLDIFATAGNRGYDLTVAHVDHGLRPESASDADFVAKAAARYGLPIEQHAAGLGQASEAAARAVRHEWLEETRVDIGALAVLTAHHQDDLLETSLLNLARGSGRLGLAPMATSPTILRPLMNLTRADLRHYASEHQIAWREDSTNADISNPRNFLRHQLLPYADAAWRASYLGNISQLAKLNKKVDQSISVILESAHVSPNTYSFPLQKVRSMKTGEFEEVLLAAARRLRPGVQLDRRLIIEAATFAKTGLPHKYRPLRQNIVINIETDCINLTTNAPR
jgi:tRNA(Ile)-lysidine synthase